MPASCVVLAMLSVVFRWSCQASPFCFLRAAEVSKGEGSGAGLNCASQSRLAYHNEMCVPSGGRARTHANLVVSSPGRHSAETRYFFLFFHTIIMSV